MPPQDTGNADGSAKAVTTADSRLPFVIMLTGRKRPTPKSGAFSLPKRRVFRNKTFVPATPSPGLGQENQSPIG